MDLRGFTAFSETAEPEDVLRGKEADGAGEHADLIPSARRFDPLAQAKHIRAFCDACPKTLRWKLRSKVGERMQWYELPEVVGH